MNETFTKILVTMVVGFVMFTGPLLGIMYLPDFPEYPYVADAARGFCWVLLTGFGGAIYSAAKRII